MASKPDLTDVEKAIISLELEKSRLNREKSMLVINKALFLYFSFLFVGVVGFVNDYLNKQFLNLLILMGLAVLVIGTIPYIRTMYSEQKQITSMIDWLKKKDREEGKKFWENLERIERSTEQ